MRAMFAVGILEDLRKDIFVRGVARTFRNDPQNLGEHRRAFVEVFGRHREGLLQIRRFLYSHASGKLSQPNTDDHLTSVLPHDRHRLHQILSTRATSRA